MVRYVFFSTDHSDFYEFFINSKALCKFKRIARLELYFRYPPKGPGASKSVCVLFFPWCTRQVASQTLQYSESRRGEGTFSKWHWLLYLRTVCRDKLGWNVKLAFVSHYRITYCHQKKQHEWTASHRNYIVVGPTLLASKSLCFRDLRDHKNGQTKPQNKNCLRRRISLLVYMKIISFGHLKIRFRMKRWIKSVRATKGDKKVNNGENSRDDPTSFLSDTFLSRLHFHNNKEGLTYQR